MAKTSNHFKKLIQAKLKEAGKTQDQLAKELGKSASAMSHLLNRGTNDPEIMKIIARFLNFDLSFLNAHSQIKSHGNVTENDCQEQLEYLKELLKAKDELIRSKDETIAALRQTIKQLN